MENKLALELKQLDKDIKNLRQKFVIPDEAHKDLVECVISNRIALAKRYLERHGYEVSLK